MTKANIPETNIFICKNTDIDFTNLEILGERILLRSISQEYKEIIFSEFTDDIVRYMLPVAPTKLKDTEEFISNAILKMKNKLDIITVIIEKKTNEFLGCCGLHSRSGHLTPEPGIWVKKSAHGNKYGLEAVKTMCAWAKENIVCNYFVYPVSVENIASIKIAECLHGSIYDEKTTHTQRNTPLHIYLYKIPL